MRVAVTEELHVYRHGVWLQQDALKYNMLIGCLIFIRWWSISRWFLYSIICNWIILRFTYSTGYSCCSHEVFINEECIWICFQQNDWNFLVGKEKYSNIAAHWKGGKRWKTKAFFLLILSFSSIMLLDLVIAKMPAKVTPQSWCWKLLSFGTQVMNGKHWSCCSTLYIFSHRCYFETEVEELEF